MTWERVWRTHAQRLVAVMTRSYGKEVAEDAVTRAYLLCIGRDVRDPAVYFGRVCRNEAKHLIKEQAQEHRVLALTASATVRHNREVTLVEEGDTLFVSMKRCRRSRKHEGRSTNPALRKRKTEWQARKRAEQRKAAA